MTIIYALRIFVLLVICDFIDCSLHQNRIFFVDASRFAVDFTFCWLLLSLLSMRGGQNFPHGWTGALIIASGTSNVDAILFRTADHLEPWLNVKQYKNGT